MEILLIRHGMTEGNRVGKYIGSTDEPLSPEGEKQIAATAKREAYQKVSRVYVSPMRRCIETAKLIFPSVASIELDGLRECHFGAFEGKTHVELERHPEYVQWIDSGGKLTPPGGEDAARFHERCGAAFIHAADESLEKNAGKIAFVTHGGVIMALLTRFSEDIGKPRGFYNWQVKNGEGWSAVAGEVWTARQELRDITRL